MFLIYSYLYIFRVHTLLHIIDPTVSRVLNYTDYFPVLQKFTRGCFSSLLSCGVICEKYMWVVATCFIFLEMVYQKYLYPFMSKPYIFSGICFAIVRNHHLNDVPAKESVTDFEVCCCLS